jgi:hypothetical protein
MTIENAKVCIAFQSKEKIQNTLKNTRHIICQFIALFFHFCVPVVPVDLLSKYFFQIDRN